ncbi:MAG: lysoplasmalogenase [Christensenellales bacterium]|jgi:uncharacterized membrane protein YhhN
MRILLWGLFAAASLIHLAACWGEKKTLAGVTKVLLMPLLAVLAGLYAPQVPALVGIGLLLGWAGDALLLFQGSGFFVAGALSFLAGHGCYIAAMAPQVAFGAVPAWGYALIVAAYVLAAALLYRGLRADLGPMRLPVLAYMAGIEAMSAVALLRMLTLPGLGPVAGFLGSVLFVVSDGVLAYSNFSKRVRIPRSGFVIMLTYIAAQALILLGFAL